MKKRFNFIFFSCLLCILHIILFIFSDNFTSFCIHISISVLLNLLSLRLLFINRPNLYVLCASYLLSFIGGSYAHSSTYMINEFLFQRAMPACAGIVLIIVIIKSGAKMLEET